MTNETKDISQEESKSKPWEICADAEKQRELEIIRIKFQANIDERKANDLKIAAIKQKIIEERQQQSFLENELKENEQAIEDKRNELIKIVLEKIQADAKIEKALSPPENLKNAHDTRRRHAATQIMESFIHGSAFDFRFNGIFKVKNQLKHLQQLSHELESDLQQFNGELEIKLAQYKKDQVEITKTNTALKKAGGVLLAEQAKLNKFMTPEGLLRLPSEQFQKVEELGNIICPPMSLLKEIYLINLANVMDTPFSTVTSFSEKFLLAVEKAKAFFNTEKRSFKTDIARLTDKLLKETTKSVQDLMTCTPPQSEEKDGELMILKLSPKEFQEKRSQLIKEAKARERKIRGIVASWKNSAYAKNRKDLKALIPIVPHDKELEKSKDGFLFMLNANGDGSTLYYPLLHDIADIFVPLKDEYFNAASLTKKTLALLEEKFERLKQQIPLENSIVVKKIDFLLAYAKKSVGEREAALAVPEAQTVPQKKAQVHFGKTRRMNLSQIHIQLSQFFAQEKAKIEAVLKVDEPVKKKRVAFADDTAALPALSFVSGIGTFHKAGTVVKGKDIVRGHQRSRTLGG